MVFRFIQKILKGKTLFRFLTEESLQREFLYLKGDVLDLASGSASYHHLFPRAVSITKTDLFPQDETTQKVDCNQALRFSDATYDGVVFVNALYTLENRESFLREVYRILKPGGKMICISPFIANEMPEPHDYARLTQEGLRKLFSEVSWTDTRIEKIGERFSASVNLLHPALFFSVVRVVMYGLALLFDSFIPEHARDRHPAPLGYTIVAIK